MLGLLAFHRLATARGDGLHPRLSELLEHRALQIEANPAIVEISTVRAGAFTQAGPCPRPKAPDFLPGNVVGFKPKAVAAMAARKSSIK